MDEDATTNVVDVEAEDEAMPVEHSSTVGPTATAPMAVPIARHQPMAIKKMPPIPTCKMAAPTVAIGSMRDDVGRF